MAQIELSLAEKNEESARNWLQMWEKPDPENSKLDAYRARLFDPKMLSRFLSKRR